MNTNGKIDQLYDMHKDPYEKVNLLSVTSDDQSDAFIALAEFRRVVASMPEEDARPRYAPRAANAWDKNPSGSQRKKRTKK